MNKILLTTALSLLSQTVFSQNFSYEGEKGPEFWADLSPEFSLCKTGKFQSPVEINDPDAIEAKTHREIKFYYTGNATFIKNNGNT